MPAEGGLEAAGSQSAGTNPYVSESRGKQVILAGSVMRLARQQAPMSVCHLAEPLGDGHDPRNRSYVCYRSRSLNSLTAQECYAALAKTAPSPGRSRQDMQRIL